MLNQSIFLLEQKCYVNAHQRNAIRYFFQCGNFTFPRPEAETIWSGSGAPQQPNQPHKSSHIIFNYNFLMSIVKFYFYWNIFIYLFLNRQAAENIVIKFYADVQLKRNIYLMTENAKQNRDKVFFCWRSFLISFCESFPLPLENFSSFVPKLRSWKKGFAPFQAWEQWEPTSLLWNSISVEFAASDKRVF